MMMTSYIVISPMRTIIDLPDDQVTRLAALCRREGLSRAEAVRRAVADYLEAKRTTQREDVFGMWRRRRLDGVDYENALRREWR